MTMTLKVAQRDDSSTPKVLRANGEIPAIVYGPKQEPIKVVLSGKEFDKVLKEAGESTIIELDGLKSKIEVLIKDVEFNPVNNKVTHVDLYAVEAGKEITTYVPLHFMGEAPAEHSHSGVVTKVLHEIEISCKPKNLPSHIDVSLESLSSVGDKIHVSDLVTPKGVSVLTGADESVAVISAIKEEVEEEKVDMDEIEVEEKGKTEEEPATE